MVGNNRSPLLHRGKSLVHADPEGVDELGTELVEKPLPADPFRPQDPDTHGLVTPDACVVGADGCQLPRDQWIAEWDDFEPIRVQREPVSRSA